MMPDNITNVTNNLMLATECRRSMILPLSDVNAAQLSSGIARTNNINHSINKHAFRAAGNASFLNCGGLVISSCTNGAFGWI